MTMEVGSFMGELVRGNEKVDVEDVRDQLENRDGCVESDVTAMALLVQTPVPCRLDRQVAENGPKDFMNT